MVSDWNSFIEEGGAFELDFDFMPPPQITQTWDEFVEDLVGPYEYDPEVDTKFLDTVIEELDSLEES